MKAFTFVRPGRPLDEVDILIDCPVDFERLIGNAERLDAEGLALPIASAEDLIEMKRRSGRDQDLADADALQRLIDARTR